MNATTALRGAGQRLWLDTISRHLLESGTLQRYINQYGVTGVTSNPTILRRQIADTDQYDDTLIPSLHEGSADPEQIVYKLAVADAQRAADLLRPTWDATYQLDGWVSIEVPPALAYRAAATIESGLHLHAQADRPNVFIKVPATQPGLVAIEELITVGVPINATLIFDHLQQRRVEDSYIRGLERRRRDGLTLRVASVASVFVSRWGQATIPYLPTTWQNRVGLAMAREIQDEHWRTLASRRWALLASSGANPQQLVWASTSAKDPALSPIYYAERLPLAGTISTMPETALLALGRSYGTATTGPDTASANATANALADCGIDQHDFATALQQQGVRTFAVDWARLLESVHTKAATSATPTRRSGAA
jgi:transaldolase